VTAAVRTRGEEYARNGWVVLRKRGSADEPVEALVRGSDAYHVRVQYEDHELLAECTCPYFADRFDVCKHIWATIVVCAQQKLEFPGYVDSVLPGDSDYVDNSEDDPFPVYATNVVPIRRAWDEPSRWRSQIRSVAQPGVLLRESDQPVPEITWIIDAHTSGPAVALEITTRSRKKNGELGKPKSLRVPYSAIAGVNSPLDREILSTISSSHYMYGSLDWRVSIYWPMAEYVVPKLVATGRLFIRKGDEYELCEAFDAGEPWRLAIRADAQEGGKYVLAGTLQRGEERLPLDAALAFTRGGFVIFRNSIARYTDEGFTSWAELLRRDKVEIPAAELDDFVLSIAASKSPVPIEWPEGIGWQERRVPPVARLELHEGHGSIYGTPLFIYDRVAVEALSPARAEYDEQRRTIFIRDAAEEARKINALWSQGFARHSDAVSIPAMRVMDAVPKLMEAGWEVSVPDGVFAGGGDLALEISSGIDWFDVNGSVTFGAEKVRLPRLLSALRKGESVVRLDDGRLGLVRSEWREQLEPFLAAASDEQESGLRFRKNQVLLLDALLATRNDVSFDDVFEQARRRILDVQVVPEQPPDSFRGALRPYQAEGLGWFSFLRELGFGGCLADDMGLGKTVQVLAMLEQRRRAAGNERRPSLVVAPRSVVFNWKSEAARFTPELRLLDHSTPDRVRAADHFAQFDVVLTTYALLRREAEFFADVEFDYAILDEAQAIKNAASQAAKAAMLLRAQHRLALSGTPVENHLGELGSLFEFLNPGMLRAKSSGVTKMLRHAGSKAPDAAVARTMLARAVRPFILRRTKTQVAPELPDRVEQTIWCELEPKQRKLYDELRDFYRASLLGRVAEKGMNSSKIHILEALLRMRQAACHPGLVDKKRVGETSAKLESLFEELPILIEGGHKVLVFSQFTSLLAIVRSQVRKLGLQHAYIDGATRDREAEVHRFQTDPQVPLFLISLKAGGLGLNLTAAEYVFLLDPWWNPAVEAQAIDRAHRIGQSRNVFAYRLVARDTIEEKILQLQQNKRALADAIIGEENSILRQLTPEDLDLLLS
jgi:superfamily II DNA or RNA helicase